MRTFLIISIFALIACEEVVVIELPPAQNLVVVEGWITDVDEQQYVRLSQSNSFSDPTPIIPITDASVVIQTRAGNTFTYIHDKVGFYRSNGNLQGIPGTEYRVRIQLSDGKEIRSGWEEMPSRVPINSLTVDSFRENDPDNSNQQVTIYFPKVAASDPDGMENYYRWVFYKNGSVNTEPESITIQDDRFFDGNLIPNNFEEFAYELDDEIIVEFQSISKSAYNYLKLLKSQITTLGTSSGTTPTIVNGNLSYISDEESSKVLGYFGTIAVSSDTTIVE